jgi:hypothetical protein
MHPDVSRDFSDASMLTSVFYGNSATRSQEPIDPIRRGGMRV